MLLHDAFKGLPYWANFMTDSKYQGVAFDTHIYQVFSQAVSTLPAPLPSYCRSPRFIQEVSRSNAARLSSACSHASDLSSFHLWTIVGEWTTAPTDCATYLNGRGRGARYDGTLSGSTYVGSCSGKTGDGSKFSSSYKAFLRQFWEAQVITYEKGASSSL